MHLCIYNVCCNTNAFLGKIVYIFKDLYMCEKWCEIKKILEGFDKFYWNSEILYIYYGNGKNKEAANKSH